MDIHRSFFTQPAVHAANGQKPAVDLSSRTRTITKTAEAGIAAVPTDIDETTTRKETVPPDAVTVDGTGGVLLLELENNYHMQH